MVLEDPSKPRRLILLFICMATKAIHLDLVSDLTSAAFIAALKRFISRRGKCSEIFCDNGTNFVGAKRELDELYDLVTSPLFRDSVSKYSTDEGIQFHFNPPSAPHHGGLWEAGVKSAKFHLRRVIGSAILNFEEYSTFLCQVEACLNSRPLCLLPNSPEDPADLTPGHFLIGNPMTAAPEPNICHLPENRLDHWQRIQQKTQDFWKRWNVEYLSSLQTRSKWTSKTTNLQIDDIVIVKDDTLPPTKWQLGRIINIHPGTDGHVRTVTIKHQGGTFKRPIVKVCVLPKD